MQPDTRSVTAASILTKATGFLRGYTHTLNPYKGCAFGTGGCGVYCYVAESPVGQLGRAPWGEWVDAQANAAELLEASLRRARAPETHRIFMSSSTDPYQPAEANYQITRSLLEVFLRHPVGLLLVQTRSPLVERDFDLIAQMPFAWLSMTVETDDDAVRRALTPTCPSIPIRLRAIQRARERGIKVQAAVSPVLPHNRDRFADLLEASADRVVVDTFVSGDGTGGTRTTRRPLAERYADIGHSNSRALADARGPPYPGVTSSVLPVRHAARRWRSAR